MTMTDVLAKPHRLVASDRVEGTAVRRPNGDRIGHIERLMIDKVTGQVSYAILSFGGFLGMGADLLPLPWARLSSNTKFEAYELDIDDEKLNAAPTAASEESFQGDWRASKVVGLSVYNDNNESLGSINDLLMDKSGNIKAVVLGVGGFLGVGEHLVAVPFDKIKFVNEPVAYTGASSGSSKSTSTTGASGSSNTAPSSSTSSSSTSATKSNPWYPDHAVFNASKDQ